MFFRFDKHVRLALTVLAGVCLILANVGNPAPSATAGPAQQLCMTHPQLCTETTDPWNFQGQYTGHDEPSTLFYSNTPGSGNRMQYRLTLPTDPSTLPNQNGTGGTWNFQLHPAFWFGMAMCDTQSYPEQVSTCTPNSDNNITAQAQHPGTAFMEMQFYPPGWVTWPAGDSCDPTKWCAALNIDSYAENPVQGTVLNDACAAQVGFEPVNFAFITRNGHAQAPANPVRATLATYTPDPSRDLFMNSGDSLQVAMHDTQDGLRIEINDLTTGQSGSMTSSADNGFGQVQYAPNPSTACNNIPYNFHPMYSTSSEQTRVIWAAHSYNIAFADEIGHFDYCNGAAPAPGGTCLTGTEGQAGDSEAVDGDDQFCFPASASSLVQIAGCLATNTGFDGTPYKPVWPDGNTVLHPTPILYSSPLTGQNYDTNYNRVAFEADLPRIELSCDRTTGAGCTRIPATDDGTPATFYPFFSAANNHGSCMWALGNYIPGTTISDFGRNLQYGSLLSLSYLTFGGGGTTTQRYNDFRWVLPLNPCPMHSQ